MDFTGEQDLLSGSLHSSVSFGSSSRETAVDALQADAVVKRALCVDKKEIFSLCKVTKDELATVTKQHPAKAKQNEEILARVDTALQSFLPLATSSADAPPAHSATPELEHLAMRFVDEFDCFRKKAEMAPHALQSVREVLPNVDSVVELLADYHAKVQYTEQSVSERMRQYRDTVADASTVLEGVCQQSAGGSTTAADRSPIDLSAWDHAHRQRIKDNVLTTVHNVEHMKADVGVLQSTIATLQETLASLHAEVAVIEAASEAPANLRDEVGLLCISNAGRLQALIDFHEDMKLRSSSDHAVLSEVAHRGSIVVRQEHEQYQQWYSESHETLLGHRAKITKVHKELRDLPLSCQRERDKREARIAVLEEEKTRIRKQALEEIETMMSALSAKVQLEQDEIDSVESATVELMTIAQNNLRTLEAQEAALSQKIESDGAERMALFEKMRENVKGIRDVVYTRSEELETLHRGSSTALNLSVFFDSLIQGCLGASTKESVHGEKTKRIRLTRLHELSLEGIEKLVLASTRRRYVHRQVSQMLSQLRPQLEEAESFCEDTGDPDKQMYSDLLKSVAAAAQDLEKVGADHEAVLLEGGNRADISIHFLKQERRQFKRPLEAAQTKWDEWHPTPPKRPCSHRGADSIGRVT